MRLFKLIVLFNLIIANKVYAFGGAGDVVWDPKLEAQVIAVYEQTVELYNNAKDQLKTAAEINKTIYEAEQAYDAIVNFDLKATANKMFGFDSSQGNEGRWKIQGLINDLDKMESTGVNTGRFYDYQFGRLENMKAMFEFQEAAAENIASATQDIPVRQSGQITAQSTASMSALLAAEDMRRQEEAARRAQANQDDQDAFFRSSDIYRGLSAKGNQ
ncbi:MAG: hypothetical protein COC14_00215 [Burkholderiaceae bacterium]|nr:MAG: hypothetical protein COC14_00215 [Burkholderiaceae bacterium]